MQHLGLFVQCLIYCLFAGFIELLILGGSNNTHVTVILRDSHCSSALFGLAIQ